MNRLLQSRTLKLSTSFKSAITSAPRLLLLMSLMLASSAVSAHDFVTNGIYYTIYDNNYVGVTYRGNSYSEYSNEYSGSVTIPNTVTYNGKTYSVTTIKEDAFRDCSGLTFISIPENVTTVFSAFKGCTSLSTVYFADSSSDKITVLYNNTYTEYYNNSTDENRYEISDEHMFEDCPLQNLYIGHRFNSVRYYESWDDYYYISTTSGSPLKSGQTINRVEYGNDITVGVPNVFGKNAIVNLYVPSIEKWCDIYQCYWDNNWEGYRGPTSNIMASCQNLYVNNVKTTSIVFPTSITTLGYGTFKDATCITSVTLPPYLSSIGDGCFYGCSNLKTVINNSSLSLTKGASDNGYVARYASSLLSPDDILIGDYQFKLSNGKYTLIGYLGDDTELVLPNNVNGEAYAINSYAFRDLLNITSVTIPESVTSIGESAFGGCSSLAEVNFNAVACNSMYNTFSGCTITTLNIGDRVTKIPANAFSGCSGLTSLTIPESVTSIGHSAFYGCSGLTSVTIAESVTSIGEYAFRGCSGLTSLTIPESVTSIGSYAFEGCSGLTSVTIPESVTSIGEYAFEGCSGLTSVTIPGTVTTIEYGTFYGCSGLTSVTISESVTSIGRSAFSGCSGLTSVTIPESVTSIGEYAFYGCSGLRDVNFNAFACICSSQIFRDCNNITNVNFGDKVTVIPANLFSYSGLKSVTIPESVTSIGEYAFEGCSGLTSVTIPGTVTTIEYGTFYGCSGLTSVTIPESVTSIGSSAFSGCSGLTSVTIPESVTEISSYAFYNCSGLTSLVIPESVTSIGSSALTNLHLQELVINTQHAFPSTQLSGTTDVLVIGENVKDVPALAFTGFETLKFNAKQCSTTNGWFAGLSTLKNVYVGDNVQMLPDNIFDGTSLETVVLGNSLKLIGTNAFNNCSTIKTINTRSLTPPTCLSHFPVQVYLEAELVVPGQALSTYKTAPTWSTFFNITTQDEIVQPAAMTMEHAVVTMNINDKTQLVVYLGSDIIPGNSLTWTSSDEEVASVNVNGQVTALAPGHATITAINSDGESVTCEVNVKESEFADLDDYLIISNVNTSRHATLDIPVYLENKSEIIAFQCDLYLPQNVSIKKNAKGNYVFAFGNRTNTMCHNISSADMPDGSVRVVVYSTNNYAFSGNTGHLFSIPVEIGDETGTWEYSIHNITLSTSDNTAVYPTDVTSSIEVRTAAEGDANGDQIINVIDVTTTVSHILGRNPEAFVFEAADMDHNSAININDVTLIVNRILDPTGTSAPQRRAPRAKESALTANLFAMEAENKVAVGETTMVPVTMSNEYPIIGYQCDIVLPECMTLALNSFGQYAFTQSARVADHTLGSSLYGENTYRIIVYSPTNAVISGNSGELFNIPVVVAQGTDAGEYTIRITNIVLSTEGNQMLEVPDVEALLIPQVKNTDSITWQIDLTDYTYEDSYQLTATAQSGLPVSYSLEILDGNTTPGEESAELTVKRGKTYLVVYEDCEIKLTATTEGDEEYSPASYESTLRFVDGRYVTPASGPVTLIDGEVYDATNDRIGVDVTYTRNFKNTNWQPLYIPFDMEYSEWSDIATVAELSGVHMYDDGRPTVIEFVTVKSGSLLPNVPYVIKAKATGSVDFVCHDKALKAAPEGESTISCSTTRYRFELRGIYQTKLKSEFVKGTDFIMGGGTFGTASSNVGPYRLYLKKLRSEEGYWPKSRAEEDEDEIIYIMVDGEICGVININADSEDEGEAYDVLGRRVAPNAKGLKIRRGSIEFVK